MDLRLLTFPPPGVTMPLTLRPVPQRRTFSTKGEISMEAKHPQENALLTGVIWKQILLFFLPVALGTFFQQMYNTVDALVVGNFVGMNALGARGRGHGLRHQPDPGLFCGRLLRRHGGHRPAVRRREPGDPLPGGPHHGGAVPRDGRGADGGGRPLCPRDADAPPPAGGADGGLRHLPPHLLRRHPADAPL